MTTTPETIESTDPAPESTVNPPVHPEGMPTEFAPRAETIPATEHETFHRQWWESVRREIDAAPELTDQGSEIGQTLRSVLRETPIFSLTPDGFRHAAAFAKARHTAATIPALQARLESLARENDRLVRLTSVTGSGPARISGESTGELSERDLRRLAAELDS